MTTGEPESNEIMKAVIMETVENQLRDNDPSETRQAYERLMSAGHSDQEARELIGAVVSTEIFSILKNNKPYDRKRYVAALQRLPTMPWE